MKVEMRDYRRDGAVYVDVDPTVDSQSKSLARLQTAGEIGAMVAGALIALAWLIVL